MTAPFQNRLAVCSWSLQPSSPEDLAAKVGRVGLRKIQLALDPLRENASLWGNTAEVLVRAGLEIVSGMFGAIGEDYSTLESIRRTGGVFPDATWADNWKDIQQNVRIARELRLKLVTFHAGFLPHDPSAPDFNKLLGRISEIGRLFADHGLELGFETGQETAETLCLFLERLRQPNVGVNFDPANMILYDKGDPISALRTLGPWLKQCHAKDAVKTARPGEWGAEVPVGDGQVDWAAWLQALRELRFAGVIAIEREAGQQRELDIQRAREFLDAKARALGYL